MRMTCPKCNDPARGGRIAWRGWYRFRCVNGHHFRFATPKKAAQNWRVATRQAQLDYAAGSARIAAQKREDVSATESAEAS